MGCEADASSKIRSGEITVDLRIPAVIYGEGVRADERDADRSQVTGDRRDVEAAG